jgi:Protein of unknown function (DUF3768)
VGTAERKLRIGQLNDELRIHHRGGTVFLTAGIRALDPKTVQAICRAVAECDMFESILPEPNERCFGLARVRDHQVVFKIEYYAPDPIFHSPDPADPSVTHRFMTIMLCEEC